MASSGIGTRNKVNPLLGHGEIQEGNGGKNQGFLSAIRRHSPQSSQAISFAFAHTFRIIDEPAIPGFERHHAACASATMLCAEVEEAGRYGRLALDAEGFVERFVEKDSSFRGKAWINAGIYFVSARLLDVIAAGTATSLERDVFERLPRRSLAAFTECFRFIDIGTPESLAQANKIFSASLGAQHSR